MSANCVSAASGSSSRSSATAAHMLSHSCRSRPGSVITTDLTVERRSSNRCERSDEALEILLARPPAERRANEAGSRKVADHDAGSVESLDDSRRLLARRTPGDERCPLDGSDDVLAGFGEERAAAL